MRPAPLRLSLALALAAALSTVAVCSASTVATAPPSALAPGPAGAATPSYETLDLGTVANHPDKARISGNGRYVGTLACPGASNATCTTQVFVDDLKQHHVEVASVSDKGAPANVAVNTFAISADGRYVVFSTAANNLVAGDTNQSEDVFLRDRVKKTTVRIDLTNKGHRQLRSGSAPLGRVALTISGDGRIVFFAASAELLGTSATTPPGYEVLYAYDVAKRRSDLASVAPDGSMATVIVLLNGGDVSASTDGRYVAFLTVPSSAATDEVYVRDRLKRRTIVASSNIPSGLQPGTGTGHTVQYAALSGDASWVEFTLQGTTPVGVVLQASRVVARNVVTGAFAAVDPSGSVQGQFAAEFGAAFDQKAHALIYQQDAMTAVAGSPASATHQWPRNGQRQLVLVDWPAAQQRTQLWPPANCAVTDSCYTSSDSDSYQVSMAANSKVAVFLGTTSLTTTALVVARW